MRSINRKSRLSVFLLLVSPFLRAQEIKLPVEVEKLSSTAKETVEVKMDGPMLRWASKFLSAEDPDEQKAAQLVQNLKSIYVRNFEFDKEGAYSSAEVEALRSQFGPPVWSRVVGVRSERNGENVDVYFKLENEKMAGIVIISAEPRELTFVNIVGPIEVDQLADLGGEFGIPKLRTKPSSSNRVAKVEKGDHK